MATEENIPEIWKAIPGYEGAYEVSSMGRIRSLQRLVTSRWGDGSTRLHRARILILHTDVDGYRWATLFRGAKPKNVRAHGAVLSAFVRLKREGEECNHIDGDKKNNTPENLEWVTARENTAHAFRTGLRRPMRAGGHAQSKLSEEQVRAIRSRFDAGETQNVMAKEFKVCRQTIGNVVHRKKWRSV